MGNCQKSFGITIRLLRLSRKLKQEQLAEKPGFSLRKFRLGRYNKKVEE